MDEDPVGNRLKLRSRLKEGTMKRSVAGVLAAVVFAFCSGAVAQKATDQDSLKAAGFTADNLYSMGFALKEINPVTPVHSDLAARVLRASAALGNANALALLAEMYLGNRIPLQPGEAAVQQAIKYMNLAWDNGSATGYFDLGLLYYNVAIPGVSEETARGATVSFVPRDYNRAFDYFVAACNKGNGKACRWTGICYEQGRGTTQDFEKGAQSYRRAGRDGTARVLLANLLVAGKGITQDLPTALTYYQAEIDRQGIDAGVSAFAMGQIYEKGNGVKADRNKAIAYYEIAAAHGDLGAKPAVDQYASGLYHNGYALLQKGNYDSALPLLVKAADLGNADALKLTGKR
jgi:TPR repeat protein